MTTGELVGYLSSRARPLGWETMTPSSALYHCSAVAIASRFWSAYRYTGRMPSPLT